MITCDQLKSLLHYEPETGLFTRLTEHGRWHVGDLCGWANGNGYVRLEIAGGRYHAHRLAWLYVHGEWPENNIDHIDGDRSNNRIANLRVANPSQNIANSRKRKASEFKGVSRRHKRWVAQITLNYKSLYLGTFNTPEEAHAAYLAAATRLFGEFARAA